MAKRKIVRVFEVKTSLLEASPVAQSAAARPGLLGKIEKLLGAGAKAAPEPEQEEEKEVGLDGESATETVIGNIFTTPGTAKRAILFLNDANLKSHYLTKTGPSELSQLVEKGEWTSDGVDGSDVRLQPQKTPELDVDDLANNPASKWGPNAVILNVKKADWNDFQTALKGTDDAAKQAALVKVLDHKGYVAVLNTNAIRAAKLPNLIDDELKLKHFDVRKFIKGYPNRAVIDAAREEWDARDEGAPESDAAAMAEGIAKVVAKAVRYVYNSIHKGKFKANLSQSKFDEALRKIIADDPLVKGNEQLIGLVQKEMLEQVAADRYPVGSLLDGYAHGDDGGSPAPVAQPEPEEKKGKEKQDKNFVDVDALDAQQIADKLAMDKTKAKAVMRALQGYHIDL